MAVVLRRGVSAAALLMAARVAHGAPAGSADAPWARTAHGAMLERILPRTVAPADLPEPQSEGARLAATYCVQCHHLPNPAMHTPARWKGIVDRMVWRMRGNGNLGATMKDLMAGVKAPTDAQAQALTAYLQRHGQSEMDANHPALRTEAGQMFTIACTQCHALPDPRRHTAAEWPGVVRRMRGYMAWANTVTGEADLRTTPELKTGEIVRLLQRYAAPGGPR